MRHLHVQEGKDNCADWKIGRWDQFGLKYLDSNSLRIAIRYSIIFLFNIFECQVFYQDIYLSDHLYITGVNRLISINFSDPAGLLQSENKPCSKSYKDVWKVILSFHGGWWIIVTQQMSLASISRMPCLYIFFVFAHFCYQLMKWRWPCRVDKLLHMYFIGEKRTPKNVDFAH